MPTRPDPRLFPTRAKWRAWLARNHATSSGVWLAYYKKHVKKNGQWNALPSNAGSYKMPPGLTKALAKNKKAGLA